MRHDLGAISLALLGLAGCLPPESGHLLVNESPFGGPQTAPPASRSAFAPPSTEAAARVDGLGRNIIAANPQLGIKPLFRTIGTSEPEVFHHGTAELDITEGLVRQCRTDASLAAILCVELGKMVSEREALAPQRRASQERDLPPEVQISGDSGSDMTRMAELGKYCEGDRRRRLGSPPLPPDPQVLARDYLTKAGYNPVELETVAPLLRSAAGNSKFEKQLTTPGPIRPWTQ